MAATVDLPLSACRPVPCARARLLEALAVLELEEAELDSRGAPAEGRGEELRRVRTQVADTQRRLLDPAVEPERRTERYATISTIQQQLETGEAMVSYVVGLERHLFGGFGGGAWALVISAQQAFAVRIPGRLERWCRPSSAGSRPRRRSWNVRQRPCTAGCSPTRWPGSDRRSSAWSCSPAAAPPPVRWSAARGCSALLALPRPRRARVAGEPLAAARRRGRHVRRLVLRAPRPRRSRGRCIAEVTGQPTVWVVAPGAV